MGRKQVTEDLVGHAEMLELILYRPWRANKKIKEEKIRGNVFMEEIQRNKNYGEMKYFGCHVERNVVLFFLLNNPLVWGLADDTIKGAI